MKTKNLTLFIFLSLFSLSQNCSKSVFEKQLKEFNDSIGKKIPKMTADLYRQAIEICGELKELGAPVYKVSSRSIYSRNDSQIIYSGSFLRDGLHHCWKESHEKEYPLSLGLGAGFQIKTPEEFFIRSVKRKALEARGFL